MLTISSMICNKGSQIYQDTVFHISEILNAVNSDYFSKKSFLICLYNILYINIYWNNIKIQITLNVIQRFFLLCTFAIVKL